MTAHSPLLDHFIAGSFLTPQTEAEFAESCAALGTQAVQLPRLLGEEQQRPIVVLGAGSVVRDGHGPAYQLANFRRLAIFDKNLAAARRLRTAFGFEQCALSLAEAVALAEQHHAVLDLALPPAAVLEILPELPAGSAVLIQKPLGKTLTETAQIQELCAARQLRVGVNLQLPSAPKWLRLLPR